MMSRIDSWHQKISTGRHFQNGYCSISTSWIDTRHRKISTGHHFQNGRHNTAKIQHCPISSRFDMWVDNDVPTLTNFYWSPFSKWPPQYRKNSTLSNIIKIWYVGRYWFPILKNFYRSHFQNGRHNTAQIQHCSISKVAFDLFFKPVVSGQFGRLHNR